jgi:hypothetical protein
MNSAVWTDRACLERVYHNDASDVICMDSPPFLWADVVFFIAKCCGIAEVSPSAMMFTDAVPEVVEVWKRLSTAGKPIRSCSFSTSPSLHEKLDHEWLQLALSERRGPKCKNGYPNEACVSVLCSCCVGVSVATAGG